MASVHTMAPVVVTGTAGTTAAAVTTATAAIRVTTFAFQNLSTSNVFIGGSAVTTTTGFRVDASDTLVLGEQTLNNTKQTFDPSNYFAVTAATGAAFVVFYSEVTNRGS